MYNFFITSIYSVKPSEINALGFMQLETGEDAKRAVRPVA